MNLNKRTCLIIDSDSETKSTRKAKPETFTRKEPLQAFKYIMKVHTLFNIKRNIPTATFKPNNHFVKEIA